MIDPAASPLFTIGGAMPETALDPVAVAGKVGGFAGLLALELKAAAPPAPAPVPAPIGGDLPLTMIEAQAALPQGGKDLPVGLPPVTKPDPGPAPIIPADAGPVGKPLLPASGTASPAPEFVTASVATPAPVTRAANSRIAKPLASPPDAESLTPEAGPAAPLHAVHPVLQARTLRHGHPIGAVDAAPSASPADSTEPEAEDEIRPGNEAQPAPISALVNTLSDPFQSARKLREPSSGDHTVASKTPPSPITQKADPAPQSATSAVLSAPAAVQSARMVIESAQMPQQAEAAPAEPSKPARDPHPAAAIQQQPIALTAPPFQSIGEVMPPVQALHRAEAPIDFTQLVDRLIAAREAVAPAEVRVSLDHAQFGKVSLAFVPDAAGLNITLASPDPEFARAIEATVAVQAAPASSETAMNNGGQSSRQGEASFSFSGGQGQTTARQNSAEPRGTGTRTAEPSDPEASQPQTERRRGIFA